jgi:hypothetical protein
LYKMKGMAAYLRCGGASKLGDTAALRVLPKARFVRKSMRTNE